MNGMINLIKSRQSCRSYSVKKVEDEKLRLILEAGRLSPSARNSQPWTLVLASSDAARQRVGECTRAGGKNKFTENCSAFIVIGMCVMNMCLEAESLGVASCILGAFDEEATKAVCKVDKSKNIKLIIALGYAEDGYPVREKTRKSYEQTVKVI